MQDRVLSYLAASTKEKLQERGIYTIFWPAYSPDLNLIKMIWNWIKDYIKLKFRDVQLFYNQLYIAVKEV